MSFRAPESGHKVVDCSREARAIFAADEDLDNLEAIREASS